VAALKQVPLRPSEGLQHGKPYGQHRSPQISLPHMPAAKSKQHGRQQDVPDGTPFW
jgi:hypothetical protein